MTYTNLSFISERIVALHARLGALWNILIYSVLEFPSVALAGNEKLPSFFKKKVVKFPVNLTHEYACKMALPWQLPRREAKQVPYFSPLFWWGPAGV